MLQKDLKRDLIPVGCMAHVIHNALGMGISKVIPIDIENVVIKIYYHFRIYTQRVEKFKEFCELVECNVKSILKHCQTRWLSLFPCVERLLQLYEAFKGYFLSEKNVPLLLFNFFKSEESLFWTLFTHAQLELFHGVLSRIQSSNVTAMEVAHEYQLLISQIEDREKHSFLPFTARNTLLVDGFAAENQVKAVARNFYFSVREYLEQWSQRLVDSTEMKLFLLDRELDVVKFATACKSILKDEKISDNLLFDTCVRLNTMIQQHLQDDDWSNKILKEKWEVILREFINNNADVAILKKIVQYICVLPGTNADCERIFSLCNQYWTDEKSHLAVPTLEAVLKIKVNVNKSCEEFFELVKNDTKLLQKFKSSEKYENN